MRYPLRTLTIVLALGLPMLAAVTCASRDSDNTPNAGSLTLYSSPAEVFNAYRKARSQRDRRTFFRCLTPDAQKDLVFETYFACGMSGSSEVAAMCERHIGDRNMFHAEYERRFKEKHGVSIADVRAKEQTERLRGPTATSDRDLLVDVLNARIQDKAGFYESAAKLLESRGSLTPIGELEQIVVDGDKATGTADIVIVSYGSAPGEPEKRIENKAPRNYNFRKVNGGWLIDLP